MKWIQVFYRRGYTCNKTAAGHLGQLLVYFAMISQGFDICHCIRLRLGLDKGWCSLTSLTLTTIRCQINAFWTLNSEWEFHYNTLLFSYDLADQHTISKAMPDRCIHDNDWYEKKADKTQTLQTKHFGRDFDHRLIKLVLSRRRRDDYFQELSIGFEHAI